MPLSSFLYTDDVDDVMAAHVNRLTASLLRGELGQAISITTQLALTDGDFPYLKLTPNADLDVLLPPEAATNHMHILENGSAAYALTIKDDSDTTTFEIVAPGGWVMCIPALGTGWKTLIQNPVLSWTPSLTNITLGNGTLTSRYIKIGRLVSFQVGLLWGSTTGFSGNIQFTLPLTPASGFSLNLPIGVARYKDATGGNANQGVVQLNSGGSTCSLIVFDAAATYASATQVNATIPFTWAQSDDLECSGFYFV